MRRQAAETMRAVVILVLSAGVVACSGPTEENEPIGPAPRPQPRDADEVAFASGIVAAEAGKWTEAAERFAEANARNPENRWALVNQGVALERSGELKGAQQVYERALRADPVDPAAATNLARTLVGLGQVQKANDVLERALEARPEDARLLNTHAGILRQMKKYRQAAGVARKVLLRDQKNVAAIKTLALIYVDRGKLQLAETLFRNALKIDSKDASIFINLGLIAYERGDHQAAISEFEQALAFEPNNAVALANIGAIALRFRDYERSRRAYAKAIAAGMVSCKTVSALGFAYEGTQEGKKAVEQLAKAYELCPNDTELLFTIGNICMGQLRDNECALEYYRKYTASKKRLAKDHPVHMLIDSLEQMKATQASGHEPARQTVPPEETPQEMVPPGEGQPELEPQPGGDTATQSWNRSEPDRGATAPRRRATGAATAHAEREDGRDGGRNAGMRDSAAGQPGPSCQAGTQKGIAGCA